MSCGVLSIEGASPSQVYDSIFPIFAAYNYRDLKRSHIVLATIIAVLILDQWLKVWIKLNLSYGEGFDILGLSWAKIHFVENPGMAFGITLGGEVGKLILSSFRIVMVGVLIYIIRGFIKNKESIGFLISFALIIAGAIGNIVDSAFYGILFSESTFHGAPATFMPAEGGYESFLHGRVVDMFHFPLIDTVLPQWVPLWGGERFEFFRPVFNVADAAISVGVISIILFHRRFFTADSSTTKEDQPTTIETSS